MSDIECAVVEFFSSGKKARAEKITKITTLEEIRGYGTIVVDKGESYESPFMAEARLDDEGLLVTKGHLIRGNKQDFSVSSAKSIPGELENYRLTKEEINRGNVYGMHLKHWGERKDPNIAFS
jgi:hypothetical protein